MPAGLKPILVTSNVPEYLVEVLTDDRAHAIVVGAFDHFEPALRYYKRLIAREPPLRVMMRRFAHVYGNYIPARLHNSYDRSAEYPI
jgi:hypothetical protein